MNVSLLLDELKDISHQWPQYNKRKNGLERYGLSLTSITGEVDNIDLDSLLEYNKENHTNLDELSFKKVTNYYNALPTLKHSLRDFDQFICRSHLIKLKQGGHFPYHRDSQFFDIDTFRLFSVIKGEEKPRIFIRWKKYKVRARQSLFYQY